jgi:hypothetical protein
VRLAEVRKGEEMRMKGREESEKSLDGRYRVAGEEKIARKRKKKEDR